MRLYEIAIGQHYDFYFGTDKFRENPNKVPISGHIAYSDNGETYLDDLFIDFATYATFFSVNNEVDDFLKEMKAQTKEIQRLREILSRTIAQQKAENEKSIVNDMVR